MSITAVVGNVALFLFTVVVLWTEGPSKGGGYVALTTLMLVVPVLSAVAILRGGPEDWLRSRLKAAAAVANVVLLALLFWAMAASYPYPEGNGVIPFAAACVAAPVLNLLALLRSGTGLTTAM